MKVYVDLTDDELRALKTCLAYSERCCQSCCTYPEMRQRNVGCDDCEFTKNVDKVTKKINNLQPLSDHTKQVRKEVVQEVRETLENLIFGGWLEIKDKTLKQILDQIATTE